MPFTVVPQGRVGIGVAQPQSGIDFPIVLPSEDIRYLLADFYLAFDQPSDYADLPAFKPPFHIHWLSGFGTIPPDFPIPVRDGSSSWSSVCLSEQSSSSGMSETVVNCMPLPKHEHDIIVMDSDGRIVFDSTSPDVSHETRTWGDRLQVVVWRHPTDQFVSLVYHTAWSPDNNPEPREYSSYFFPDAAVLDDRAIRRLPKRVRSFTVVLDNLRKTGVEFAAGYNMELLVGPTIEPAGQRRTTRVTFNATSGAGLGVFPDCSPDTLKIAQINGVQPTSQGDFFLAATDCYWIRQPTRVVGSDPMVTTPQINLVPGSIPTAGLPDPAAGTTKIALGWPHNDDVRYAHLQIGNDCPPCCDCPDYVEVARYMNTVRNQYQSLGKQFEGSRDLYHLNRERWLTSADCMQRKPLRLRMLPQLCPFMDVAIQFCNQTGKCQTGVELTVSFATSPSGGTGEELLGFTFITGARSIPGRTAPATDRYEMGGTWPTFTAFYDSVQPGQSVSARFRLKFADCGMGGDTAFAVTGTLTGTTDGGPLMVKSTGDTMVTAVATDLQTLNCPAVDTSLNLLECACDR